MSLIDSEYNQDSQELSVNLDSKVYKIQQDQETTEKQNQFEIENKLFQTNFDKYNKFPKITNAMGQSQVFQNQQYSTNDFSLASTNQHNQSSNNKSKNFDLYKHKFAGLNVQKSMNFKRNINQNIIKN